MKLNNNGWGLKEMIIFCCLLFIFFCVAIYFIHVFYTSLGMNIKSGEENIDYQIYENMEENLENAAQNYILENGFGYSMVSARTLVNMGYLDSFTDPITDKSCHGYVNINQDNNTYSAYISCDNYITEGYGD